MKEADKKNSFLALDNKSISYKDSEIVILPIEYSDFAKKNSQSNSSREIIKASACLEKYDEEMGRDLQSQTGICTSRALNLLSSSYKKASTRIAAEITQLIEDRKFVVSICGSHSIALPIMKTVSEKFTNLSILHLDSKANLKSGKEIKTNHDGLISLASEFNSKIIQVGIRSMSFEENELRKETQIRQFQTREIKMGMYGSDWQEIVEKNLSDNVYITIDLSVFDSYIFPNVETPEPGGLFWDELLCLLKIVGQRRKIVGFDICGLIPNKIHSSSNYFAAKLIYKILNYSF
jgi:agmatinase